jgi:hypothetical protein
MPPVWLRPILLVVLAVIADPGSCAAQPSGRFLGFDRNRYPGDQYLAVLRRSFSFVGYWLNNPPGESENTWIGKRQRLEAAGFGFLVVFNGRHYASLKQNAGQLGQADAQAAASVARREGFPTATIIFLDIEEGGRMLPEQKAYIYAWVDTISSAGFGAGVYCSGIPANEAEVSIVTAEDIRASAQGRRIAFWVANDTCPPSPGCSFSALPSSAQSGVHFADVWQFAQSPRRPDFARMCRNYHPDGNCYPPGVRPASGLHVDLNSATTQDPSHGRMH